MQSFLIQTASSTFRTSHRLGELFRPFLCRSRSFVLLHHLDVFHQSLVGHIIIRRGVHQLRLDAIHAAVQYFVQRFLRQILDRCLHISVVFFQQSIYLPEYHAVFILPQRLDSPLVHRKVTVRNHFIHVYQADIAQSFAPRTSPLRRVERKVMRSRVTVGQTGFGAHQTFTVMTYGLCFGIVNHKLTFPLLHGRGHTGVQPFVILLLYAKLIHNDFYAVVLITVEFHPMDYLANLAVHAHI